MKFKITLRDGPNGTVRVDCDPNFETMANIAREKSDKLTPAAAYTLGALAYIKRKSIENMQEQMKEKYDEGKFGDEHLPLYNPESKLFN